VGQTGQVDRSKMAQGQALAQPLRRATHYALLRLKTSLAFIVLLVFAGAFLVPIVWMVSTSLKVDAQVFTDPPTWLPSPLKWSNYADALTYFDFGPDLRNTLTITLPAVTGTLISSALVAYSLSRLQWPGRDVVFAFILATMMIPKWVTLIPLYILFNKIGWVGTFLPLQVPAWAGDAFSIFLLRQFFRQLPQEMFDAAAIDGAGHATMFWRLVLPLSKPALAVVVLFSFTNNWTDFLGPLIYLSDPSQYTLMLGQYNFFGVHSTAWTQLMASNVMILAPMIILYFFTQRLFIAGITFTGLRG